MKPHAPIAGMVLLLLSAGACARHKAAAPAVAAVPAASASAAPADAAPAPAVEPPLPYELRLGRETYQHYCLTCHGDTGAGDGFNAFNLDPHPTDLTAPAFQKAKTEAALKDAVQRGGAGVGLSPLMPPYGKTLTPDQIDQVVGYIRTFKKTEP